MCIELALDILSEKGGAKEKRWINTCTRLAARNKKAHPYRFAAVLVRGGKILGIGFNRIKNYPIKPGTGNQNYQCKSIHCEIDVLRRVENIQGATMFLVGLTKGKNYAYSKPCPKCQEALKESFAQGLKAVYYATPDGIQILEEVG